MVNLKKYFGIKTDKFGKDMKFTYGGRVSKENSKFYCRDCGKILHMENREGYPYYCPDCLKKRGK